MTGSETATMGSNLSHVAAAGTKLQFRFCLRSAGTLGGPVARFDVGTYIPHWFVWQPIHFAKLKSTATEQLLAAVKAHPTCL